MITLLAVWAALMLLLGLTVGLALSSIGASAALASAALIATAKMALVLWFFMELRRARWALRLAAAAGFAMLGILLAGTLADSLTRPRDNHPQAPRRGVTRPSMARDAGVVVPGEAFR
jgi:cytochrome c oxidase subunit 4